MSLILVCRNAFEILIHLYIFHGKQIRVSLVIEWSMIGRKSLFFYLEGTARYASINAHKGSEQSRRDDLEAISYVFMYFIIGILPWQGLQGTAKKAKFERIAEMKMQMSAEQICKNQPKECILFLNYCRTLPFDHRPDYDYLHHLFRHLLYQIGETYDYEYDWILTHRQKRLTQQSTEKDYSTVSEHV